MVSVSVITNLIEPIHVELPDEGTKVAVFEVGGQHMLNESGYISDHEPVPRLEPGNERVAFGILCCIIKRLLPEWRGVFPGRLNCVIETSNLLHALFLYKYKY